MGESNGAGVLSNEAFRGSFSALKPLILSEWPTIDGEALSATGGELDRVVDLLADRTQHTRPVLRMKLAELHHLSESAPRGGSHIFERQLQEMLANLERKTADLAAELRSTVLPVAREKVRDNLLMTLLVVLGLGFIVGLLFRGGGRHSS